jgi:hypothetical protein
MFVGGQAYLGEKPSNARNSNRKKSNFHQNDFEFAKLKPAKVTIPRVSFPLLFPRERVVKHVIRTTTLKRKTQNLKVRIINKADGGEEEFRINTYKTRPESCRFDRTSVRLRVRE